MDSEPIRPADDDREGVAPIEIVTERGINAKPEEEPKVRPEILAIFEARWERNEPAYRFLAEH